MELLLPDDAPAGAVQVLYKVVGAGTGLLAALAPGAAIDVLPEEPPLEGDPLLDYRGPNLVVTPHIAWATDAARQNAIDELAANTRAFLRGEERNRVV